MLRMLLASKCFFHVKTRDDWLVRSRVSQRKLPIQLALVQMSLRYFQRLSFCHRRSWGYIACGGVCVVVRCNVKVVHVRQGVSQCTITKRRAMQCVCTRHLILLMEVSTSLTLDPAYPHRKLIDKHEVRCNFCCASTALAGSRDILCYAQASARHDWRV